MGVKIDLIAFKSIKDFENAGKMFKDGLTKGITLFQLVILIHLESPRAQTLKLEFLKCFWAFKNCVIVLLKF